jgi:hypothetical protein
MPRRTDPTRAYDYTVAVRREAAEPAEGYSALDPQTLCGDPTTQRSATGNNGVQTLIDDQVVPGDSLAGRNHQVARPFEGVPRNALTRPS